MRFPKFIPNRKFDTPLPPTDLPVSSYSTPLILRSGLWHQQGANSSITSKVHIVVFEPFGSPKVFFFFFCFSQFKSVLMLIHCIISYKKYVSDEKNISIFRKNPKIEIKVFMYLYASLSFCVCVCVSMWQKNLCALYLKTKRLKFMFTITHWKNRNSKFFNGYEIFFIWRFLNFRCSGHFAFNCTQHC